MELLPLECTNIYKSLFDETSGACVKLMSLNINDVSCINDHFKVIDEIWSKSSNIQSDDLVQIKENFVNWGVRLITKLICANKFFKEADRLLEYMLLILNSLPIDQIGRASHFDKKSLFLIFNELNIYNDESPLLLVSILTKICKFCEKEFSNKFLFFKVMEKIQYMVADVDHYPALEELYRYSSLVLRLHCDSLEDRKLNDDSVINSLTFLIRIRNVNESHQVAIMHFWWQFICSLKTESIFLMDYCNIFTFLSKLFGAFLTLTSNKSFSHELPGNTCFTNRDSLGPLCNHVMNQILLSVAQSTPQYLYMINNDIDKWQKSLAVTKYYSDTFEQLSLDLFKDNYSLMVHLEPLLVAFGYWCQFCDPIIEKTPFRLLRIVFSTIWKRFLTEDDSNELNRPAIKQEPTTLNPSLWKLVELFIPMKNVVESNLARSSDFLFGDHSNLISHIVKHLSVTDELLRLGPDWRRVTKILLMDSMKSMSHALFRPASDCKIILTDHYNMWIVSCSYLLGLLWPVEGGPGPRVVCEELAELMCAWCGTVLEDHNIASIHTKNIWHTSIKWWAAIVTNILAIVNSQSFTLDFVTDKSLLAPFVDFFVIPTVFLAQCDLYTLVKDDYLYLRDMFDNIFSVISSMIDLLGPDMAADWYNDVCKTLVNALCHVDSDSYSNKILLLNFSARIVDVIVSRCPSLPTDYDISQYKKGPLWQCVHALERIMEMFTSDNIRLYVKGTMSKKRLFATDEEASSMTTTVERDLDFTMALVMTTCDNILIKLGKNAHIVKVIMDRVLPPMSSVAQMFFQDKEQQMTKTGWKHIPQLQKEGQKIEDLFISLLNHIKVSNNGTNIFPIVKPILSALFSILNDQIVSQSTIEFVLNYWTDVIMANEKQYDNVFSDEFIKQLDSVKFIYPQLQVTFPDNVKARRKSKITDLSTEKKSPNPLKRKKSLQKNETVDVSLKIPSPQKTKRQTLLETPVIDKKTRIMQNNQLTITKLTSEKNTKRKLSVDNSEIRRSLDRSKDDGCHKSDEVLIKRSRHFLDITENGHDNNAAKIVPVKVGRVINTRHSAAATTARENYTSPMKIVQARQDNVNINSEHREKSKVGRPSRLSRETVEEKIVRLPSGRGRWKNHIPKSVRQSEESKRVNEDTVLQVTNGEDVSIVSPSVTPLSSERVAVIMHDIARFSPAKNNNKVAKVMAVDKGKVNCDDCIVTMNGNYHHQESRGVDSSPLVIGRTFSMAHKDSKIIESPQKKRNSPTQTDCDRGGPNKMNSDYKRERRLSFTGAANNQNKETIVMTEDSVDDIKGKYLLSLMNSRVNGDGLRRDEEMNSSYGDSRRVSLCQDLLPNTTRELERFKEALLVVKEGLRVGSMERFRETVRFLFDKD